MTVLDRCIIASELPPRQWPAAVIACTGISRTIFGRMHVQFRSFISTPHDQPLIEWLVELGLSPSKGQARTAIKQGAVRLNRDKQVRDLDYRLAIEDVLPIGCVAIECGRFNYAVLHIEDLEPMDAKPSGLDSCAHVS